MLINSVNNYQYSQAIPSFGINLESKKLRFKNEDFFVKLKGYGTNVYWAKEIINAADNAVKRIRENLDFESVLMFITAGVKKANQYTTEQLKRKFTGILRAERGNWQNVRSDEVLITPYGGGKSVYKRYRDRFDNVAKHPLKNPFDNFSLTQPEIDKDWGKLLIHPKSKYINNSLDMVRDLYNDLHAKYIEKEATKSDLADINDRVAEIRWILAHSTPWNRGSDAISNTFMRSIYKAMGIKAYPLKRGVSLDLEAYCTNLDDYKTKFTKYFKHAPKIID